MLSHVTQTKNILNQRNDFWDKRTMDVGEKHILKNKRKKKCHDGKCDKDWEDGICNIIWQIKFHVDIKERNYSDMEQQRPIWLAKKTVLKFTKLILFWFPLFWRLSLSSYKLRLGKQYYTNHIITSEEHAEINHINGARIKSWIKSFWSAHLPLLSKYKLVSCGDGAYTTTGRPSVVSSPIPGMNGTSVASADRAAVKLKLSVLSSSSLNDAATLENTLEEPAVQWGK